VNPKAFVHPTAVLIGDVIVAANCYVGPNAVLRGDFGRVAMHEGSNIQDTCVMHTFPNMDCVIERDGHVGHGAVLHGCRIGSNALVGMNAVIMDEADIGEASIIGAGAFVKSGFSCPPRSLVAGAPAKVIRTLEDAEIDWKSEGTAFYHELVARSLATLHEVEPLTEPEANRRRINCRHLKIKKDL